MRKCRHWPITRTCNDIVLYYPLYYYIDDIIFAICYTHQSSVTHQLIDTVIRIIVSHLLMYIIESLLSLPLLISLIVIIVRQRVIAAVLYRPRPLISRQHAAQCLSLSLYSIQFTDSRADKVYIVIVLCGDIVIFILLIKLSFIWCVRCWGCSCVGIRCGCCACAMIKNSGLYFS